MESMEVPGRVSWEREQGKRVFNKIQDKENIPTSFLKFQEDQIFELCYFQSPEPHLIKFCCRYYHVGNIKWTRHMSFPHC